ncbi:MAG: hypothetical protein ACRD1E_04420 [Terriglobales bacterium]
MGTLALALIAVAIFLRYEWGRSWTPWQAAGLAIAVPAFVLFLLARIQLGQAFSVRAKATALVTTGIYARIRNPV